METILYHGAPEGCSFGAIVALEWLCRPYRLLRVDLPGMPAPALQQGGRLLSGCRAILRHIGRQRRCLLGYREGTPQAARLDALLDFLHEEFQAGEARMVLACSRLDAMLAQSEWLDGCKRTVADACLVAVLRWAERHAGLRLGAWPHLQRHVVAMQGDAAVFFADAVEARRPAVSSGRFMGHLDALRLAA